jgi:hypothetical protein
VEACLRGSKQRTHEEVVGIGIGAANFEQLHQVVELAVYVAADCDGTFLGGNVSEAGEADRHNNKTYHWLHIGLFLKNFSSLEATAAISMRLHFVSDSKQITLSHSRCTSLSASCLQFMRLSIQPSSVGIVVGSLEGTDESAMGSGILTSSMLVSMLASEMWWGGRRVRGGGNWVG